MFFLAIKLWTSVGDQWFCLFSWSVGNGVWTHVSSFTDMDYRKIFSHSFYYSLVFTSERFLRRGTDFFLKYFLFQLAQLFKMFGAMF